MSRRTVKKSKPKGPTAADWLACAVAPVIRAEVKPGETASAALARAILPKPRNQKP